MRRPTRTFRRPAVVAVALVASFTLVAGCTGQPPAPVADRSPSTPSAVASDARAPYAPRSTVAAPTMEPEPPLAGRVVVLDPGHQLGNASFPAEVNAPVDAGGFTKACNTTGTATDAGYPEATFTWQVAQVLRRMLRDAGARVLMTRTSNSATQWGPCIDERGRAGNPEQPGPTADVKVSIHADGSLTAGAHGFHVIAPAEVDPWTTDIAAPSLLLAGIVRDALVEEGVATSTYAGTDGIDVRGDLGTLNLADVPSVLVELGNMRDPGDAALMGSAAGRRGYASALTSAIERFLVL